MTGNVPGPRIRNELHYQVLNTDARQSSGADADAAITALTAGQALFFQKGYLDTPPCQLRSKG